MYSIILNDGKTIDIKADMVEWYEREKMVRFLYEENVVARINMDAVVGWVKTDNYRGIKNEMEEEEE